MIFMCKLLSTLFLHCKLSLQTPNVCILVWGDNISLVLLEGRIDELQYGFFLGGGFIHCRKKPLPQCSEAHSRVTVLILSVLHC